MVVFVVAAAVVQLFVTDVWSAMIQGAHESATVSSVVVLSNALVTVHNSRTLNATNWLSGAVLRSSDRT